MQRPCFWIDLVYVVFLSEVTLWRVAMASHCWERVSHHTQRISVTD